MNFKVDLNIHPNCVAWGHHLSQNIFRTCITVCYFYIPLYIIFIQQYLPYAIISYISWKNIYIYISASFSVCTVVVCSTACCWCSFSMMYICVYLSVLLMGNFSKGSIEGVLLRFSWYGRATLGERYMGARLLECEREVYMETIFHNIYTQFT